GATFPIGTTTNTFVVTDASGNTATCSFDVTITDNELPIITCPTDINQTADSGICGASISIINPTATDNCSTVFTFVGVRSDNLALTDIYPVGVTTITWTATDEANNTSTPCTQVITITDNQPPVFVELLPIDATVECDQVPTAEILTATDNCNSANVDFEEITTAGSCDSNYILTRTWIATDTSENTTTHVQIITVQDTTAPVLSLPANVSAECSDDLSPIAFGTATATDNCDPSPVVTYNDVITSGACSGTYTITRTWTATDVCGNISTADQIISTSDTTAPEFVENTLPGDITVECSSIPAAETLTATDNCGTATVTVNDVRTNGDCANNYIITRTWTATDECGLTKTHIQTITVQDTTPPTFVETTLPPTNLVVECDAVPTAVTLTATDICGSATVSVNDVRTNGNCPNNYTLTRTWTATDECGNTTKHTQIIIVKDTKAPKFVEALPSNITVECDAVPTAQTITATDNCGTATVTVKDVITNGDCPNNYIIARTWTATDECGLTTIHTQIITVQDTKAPVPTTTFDNILNVSCTNIPDVPALTFTDNCSSASNIIVVFNETSTFADNVYNDYEIVRTWTVRDECSNEAIYKQTLNVALDEIITDIVAQDRCFDDGIVNLNDLIPSTLNTNGTWEMLEGNPVATLTGNIFNPTTLELAADFLPDDGGMDYIFRYTTTDNGCISITDLTMNINADCVVLPCGENDVEISKAVTPNGDAYNEFFEISGIELCGFRYDVKIFNRWGALIYESNDYQNDWNGTASRKSVGAASKVPNGTYYYIVTLKDSGLAPFTGPVYLGTK
ncbi:gliding motility-associated C-terminal domain-containing protein, partial [Mariniflexile soesokkakense]